MACNTRSLGAAMQEKVPTSETAAGVCVFEQKTEHYVWGSVDVIWDGVWP